MNNIIISEIPSLLKINISEFIEFIELIEYDQQSFSYKVFDTSYCWNKIQIYNHRHKKWLKINDAPDMFKKIIDFIKLHNMNELENCIADDYRVYIDTCTLMTAENDDFFQKMANYLEKTNKKAFMPDSVIKELNKINKNAELFIKDNDCHKDNEIMTKMKEQFLYSTQGLKIFNNLNSKNLLSIIQIDKSDLSIDESYSFADNDFITEFCRIRTHLNSYLLTRDRGLAEDVKNLNVNSMSVNRLKNTLIYILDTDLLVPIKFFSYSSKSNNKNLQVNLNSEQKPIELNYYSLNGKYYNDQNNKFYKKFNSTDENLTRKIQKMLLTNMKQPDVRWPIKLIEGNDKKNIQGYIIRSLDGQTLDSTLFNEVYLKNNPQFTSDIFIAEICVKILQKFIYLKEHDVNPVTVIPGDLLFREKNKDFYIINCDEFKFDNFKGREITPELLSNENELRNDIFNISLDFSITSLLFKIFMYGADHNDFIFNASRIQAKHNITSHNESIKYLEKIPDNIKKIFSEAFSLKIEKIPKINNWLAIFNGYRKILLKNNI